jgi:hypothetical protein
VSGHGKAKRTLTGGDRIAGALDVGGAAVDQRGRPDDRQVTPLTDEERAIIRLLARLALEEWLDGEAK